MDEETAAHVAALTAGMLELCGVLAQRHVIDAGDLGAIHDIMHHALRKRGDADPHEHARNQLAQWIVRASELAPESLPLPPI
ncbi:hypothetical protein [uncultured Sphingomonas sp.]|uniref:hypothetical protein n=1 Tax=uncultured Sphingomonas sp. TaxID=158754 RepID=UPI0035CA14F3